MTSSLPSSRNNSVSKPRGVDMSQSAIKCVEKRMSDLVSHLFKMYPKHMHDTQLIESLQHELKQHTIAHAVLRRMQLKDNKPWKLPVV